MDEKTKRNPLHSVKTKLVGAMVIAMAIMMTCLSVVLIRNLRIPMGASSERTQAIIDSVEQISLFNETESLENKGGPGPELEQVTYKRRKQKGKREMDFSGLPVEQIVHELPEDERICSECGKPLHACGHQVLRRELAYVPAQYKVVEHVQLPPL